MHGSFQTAFLAPRRVFVSGPAPAAGRQLDNTGPSRDSHKAAAASDRWWGGRRVRPGRGARGSEPQPPPASCSALFYLFKSQECRSLKPSDLRAATRRWWCRDLKADPPCVSHRQPSPPTPTVPPPPASGLPVHRSTQTHTFVYFAFVVFFFVVSIFTVCKEGEKPKIRSQIKTLRPGAICYHCLLSCGPQYTLWLDTVCLKRKVYHTQNERFFLGIFHPLLFLGRNFNEEL